MKNKLISTWVILLLIIILFTNCASTSSNNTELKGSSSPMDGWEFTRSTTLNGKLFNQGDSIVDSFREQYGFAVVQGEQLQYWLYDTITYHNGDSSIIYESVIPQWLENKGYVIDYDNITIFDPNPELAQSVRALMTQKNCNISICKYDLLGLVINEYIPSRDVYKTTNYPLYLKNLPIY